MKANGIWAAHMEKENSPTHKARFMMGHGAMIRPTDRVLIYIVMEPNMKADGEETCRMVSELKSGQIHLSSLDSISTAKRTDWVSISGPMEPFTKANGMTTRSLATATISGAMAAST